MALICKLIGHRLRWQLYDRVNVCACVRCPRILAVAPIPREAALDALQNTDGRPAIDSWPGCID
jgi:hypothetical protein